MEDRGDKGAYGMRLRNRDVVGIVQDPETGWFRPLTYGELDKRDKRMVRKELHVPDIEDHNTMEPWRKKQGSRH
jgi:hypothetical protein